MTEWLESIDRSLFLALNGFHFRVLDEPMFYISKIWIFTPLFIYWIILAYKKFSGKKFAIFAISIALLITLTDQTATQTKNAVKRYRPTHNIEIQQQVHVVREYRGGDYGFFSGHAANTFGIATLLFLIFKRRSGIFRSTFLMWALLTSYSRIYLGVHYPSDIIVGILVGVFWGFVVYKLLMFTVDKYFPEEDIAHLHGF